LDPPQSEKYHLETDASVNRAQRQEGEVGRPLFLSGGGVVLRDLSMLPVEEHAVTLGYLPSIYEAERAALLWGLRRALAKGIRRLRVRNDNLALIQTIQRARNEATFHTPLEFADLLKAATEFDFVEFRWMRSVHATTRGDGAHSADFLARRACGLGTRSR
jgi:ribonuclease HI